MAEPSENLLKLIGEMYSEAEGFTEDDFDNGEVQAQFIPKKGVEAFSPPVQVGVGTRVLTPPRLTPVNPGMGGLAVFAMFVPFIKRIDDWMTETVVERETKRILKFTAELFNKAGIGLLELPMPEPEAKPPKLPVRQKRKQKHKESRIRIYGYSKRLSGSNTIRPPSRPS